VGTAGQQQGGAGGKEQGTQGHVHGSFLSG
jgi:hypothetical protein